jgi:hypothetical protein
LAFPSKKLPSGVPYQQTRKKVTCLFWTLLKLSSHFLCALPITH